MSLDLTPSQRAPEAVVALPYLSSRCILLFLTVGAGRVRGDTLIDISMGPTVYHLFSFSDIFKEITVIEFTEPNIQELKKGLKRIQGLLVVICSKGSL
ncbi:hypothetical protein FKM82_017909 [Ascaphus truei]